MASISSVTLLWSNASPGSSFAAQTVSDLNLAPYDFIVFAYNRSTTNQRAASMCAPVSSGQINLQYTQPASGDQGARPVTWTSTSISFGACHAGSNTAANGNCIPTHVYGVSL